VYSRATSLPTPGNFDPPLATLNNSQTESNQDLQRQISVGNAGPPPRQHRARRRDIPAVENSITPTMPSTRPYISVGNTGLPSPIVKSPELDQKDEPLAQIVIDNNGTPQTTQVTDTKKSDEMGCMGLFFCGVLWVVACPCMCIVFMCCD